jgi:type I restriction enzyme M protein
MADITYTSIRRIVVDNNGSISLSNLLLKLKETFHGYEDASLDDLRRMISDNYGAFKLIDDLVEMRKFYGNSKIHDFLSSEQEEESIRLYLNSVYSVIRNISAHMSGPKIDPLLHFSGIILFDRIHNYHFSNCNIDDIDSLQNYPVVHDIYNHPESLNQYKHRIALINKFGPFAGSYDLISKDLSAISEETKRLYQAAFNQCIAFNSKLFSSNLFGILFSRFIASKLENAKNKSEHISPQLVSRLIARSIKIKPSESVYDPAIGTGSFMTELAYENNCYNFKVIGGDIDLISICLCRINLLLNGLFDIELRQENSLAATSISMSSIDYCVSNPPFGKVKVSEMNTAYQVGQKGTVDNGVAFFNLMLQKVKPHGKIYNVVTDNFLYALSIQDYRKYLVQLNLVEQVVSLPFNLFKFYANVSADLVTLQKSGNNEDVLFCDGRDSLVNYKDNHVPQFLVEGFINGLLDEDAEGEHDIYIGRSKVAKSEIELNDFILTPSRYVEEYTYITRPQFPLVRLSELVVHLRTEKVKIALSKGPIMKIRNLQTDSYNPITYHNLENGLANVAFNILNQDALLLALKFDDAKPTLFKTTPGNPIYFTNDIAAFSINSNIVDPEYLICQLQSEYCQKQFKKYRKGGVITSITVNDLLKIEIALPGSTIDQRAIVEGIKEAAIKAKLKEAGLDAEIERIKAEFIDDLKMKKHNLAPIVSNLVSAYESLMIYIGNNHGKLALTDVISRNQNITVSQHLLSFRESLGDIVLMMGNLTDESKFGKAEIIDANDIINETVNKLDGKEGLMIEYMFDMGSFMLEDNLKWVKPMISISKIDFTTLVNNVVSNALIHGYDGNYNLAKSMIIVLRYTEEKRMVQFEFRNNGKPFPKGMTKERYITRGEKAGLSGNTGLGGYIINQIATHFGGNLEIKGDETSDYPVSIIINLPIINQDEI